MLLEIFKYLCILLSVVITASINRMASRAQTFETSALTQLHWWFSALCLFSIYECLCFLSKKKWILIYLPLSLQMKIQNIVIKSTVANKEINPHVIKWSVHFSAWIVFVLLISQLLLMSIPSIHASLNKSLVY